MKKAFLALLFLTFPALAATVTSVADTSQPNTMSLVATNDAVCFNHYYGTKWATVRWTVSTAGSGGITTEYSKDGGTNFLPLPYSTLTSTVAVNPSTAPWANNTPVAGSYETPVPGNTTDVCVRYQTGGTATTITLTAGLPFVPTVPVVATLYDVTEGSIGAGFASPTLDLTGWQTLSAVLISPTTNGVLLRPLDNAGNLLSGTQFTGTAASTATIMLSRAAGTGSGTYPVAASSITSAPLAFPRYNVLLAAGGTVSLGRAQVFVSR